MSESAPKIDNGVFAPFGAAVSVSVLVLDQLTKWWVLDHFTKSPGSVEILPVFNLVLVWNWGVSFGLFSGQHALWSWGLITLALAISGFFARWLWSAENRLVALGVSLIIGGAIGNVIDRIRFGAVVDFLDVHVLGYHWPAFNVADAAITMGAAALVIEAVFGKEPGNKESGDSDATKKPN